MIFILGIFGSGGHQLFNPLLKRRESRQQFHRFQRCFMHVCPACELVQIRADPRQFAMDPFFFRRSPQTEMQTRLPDVVGHAHAVHTRVELEQIALLGVNADNDRRCAGRRCCLHAFCLLGFEGAKPIASPIAVAERIDDG